MIDNARRGRRVSQSVRARRNYKKRGAQISALKRARKKSVHPKEAGGFFGRRRQINDFLCRAISAQKAPKSVGARG